MTDEPKRDWEKTWLHFFCGAAVGGGIGTYFWFDSSWNQSWLIGAAFIIGGGLVIGFLSALFLDDFWEKFLEWFRWW